MGLPGYAQFDNDTIFQGPPQHKDVIGRVMKACLGLGVVPVFAPPPETGFQASIEAYNGRWQAKVWARFVQGSLEDVQARSGRFVAAARDVPRRGSRRPRVVARSPPAGRWTCKSTSQPGGLPAASAT